MSTFVSRLGIPISSPANTWRMSKLWYPDERSSVQATLLRLIVVAHRENLELAPLVAQLAEEHRWPARRRLVHLAQRLASGTPLVAALEQSPGVLADEDVLKLRFAAETGTTPQALETIQKQPDPAAFESRYRRRQTLMHFACMLLAVGLALFFLMIFIVPVCFQIGGELGLDMGYHGRVWFFAYLVSASNFVAQYLPLGLALLVILAVVFCVFKPGRYFRHVFASRLLRPVAQLRAAHLLRLLAMANDAGRPIPGALSTLARYHFDRNIRTKLLFSRNEVEQGMDAWESLASSQLLTDAESRALAGSSTSRGRSWLMRKLAERKEMEFQQRSTVATLLFHPLMVLFFGACILWVGLAFVGFLAFLISSLA